MVYAKDQALLDMEWTFRPQRDGGLEQFGGRLKDADIFEGVAHDPQTLHKYTYGHGDPVNNTDPTGLFSYTNLLVTAGISGLISSSMVGAYGYAKGWSAGQIAKASTYAFFVGALGGAAAYGVAWGVAAGAAVASGFVAAEASAFASIGWTSVGLITTPTSLGVAIADIIETERDPNADATDRAFARFNLAIAAFVFVGVRAQAISGLPDPVWIAQGDRQAEIYRQQVVKEIMQLPPTTQLSAEQMAVLRNNVNVLKEVIATKGYTQEMADRISNIVRTDPRFSNLSQSQRDAFVAEAQQMVKN